MCDVKWHASPERCAESGATLGCQLLGTTVKDLTVCECVRLDGNPHRNKGMQEVEGLVYGGVSINVALGDELVMNDSVQSHGQLQSLLLQSLLLLLNGGSFPFHLNPGLFQVLTLPAEMVFDCAYEICVFE